MASSEYEWLDEGQQIRCPSGRTLDGLDEICTELASRCGMQFFHGETTWHSVLKYKDGKRWKTKALNMVDVVRWLNEGEVS